MSLLKKIFGEKPEVSISKLKWIPLTEQSQLNEISNSKKPVAIFKHSTRCYTSIIIKKQFEKGFDYDTDQIEVYYLDLLSYREISDEIASKFSIRHESPQLLVIKENKLVTDSSHMGIMKLDLSQFI